MKHLLLLVALLPGILSSAASDPAWPPALINSLASLPVQDGGRVKPLDEFARIRLLKFYGSKTMRLRAADGKPRKLQATEWLLDCLWRPEVAADYPTFRVDNSDTVAAIGIPTHEKRRDRYSYAELEPGLKQLFRLARQYVQVPEAERDDSQTRILHLADCVGEYERLTRRAGPAQSLALFPPQMPDQVTWQSLESLLGAQPDEATQAALQALRETTAVPPGSPELSARVEHFVSALAPLSASRTDARRVPLEARYLRANLLPRAHVLFILGLLLVMISWLTPASQAGTWLRRGAYSLSAAALLLLATAIVLRCIIRGRPPVTTLYESVLFTTAIACLCALAVEWRNRLGLALSAAPILGSCGLFLAYRHELQQGIDTMPSMIAVLDSNFWLSTHVTTITIGYAAGLLAGTLSHLYLLGQCLRLPLGGDRFRLLTSAVYGTLCGCLLFSFIGTVLGGIWANYSWGRFWGWDPKENGALLIVLWCLAILHARAGGHIAQLGLHIASVIGGMVIVFSWWGVNLLGVGLHSYGFTSGAAVWLATFWGVEMLFLLLVAMVAPMRPVESSQPSPPPVQPINGQCSTAPSPQNPNHPLS